ncbi:hypothetical protein FLL45_06910 [Aliikangiella marina]|uniref:Integrase SAM-like N-terminal domain-containing protein n=1 Tax=Aliikangiella marina TaxID=1712262 RepID=A0A545TBU7_9GAMM|nr:phage integrase N-terminal SAM-like domain-containing protein [Aliikangiella marina]TQV74684.1 hypothetical protein FLL45_06910 [Aliikangiella marina]
MVAEKRECKPRSPESFRVSPAPPVIASEKLASEKLTPQKLAPEQLTLIANTDPVSSEALELSSWLEQLQLVALRNQLSHEITKSYTAWVLRFVHFYKSKNRPSYNQTDLENYLSYLARELNHDYNAQQSACDALSFFYQHILKTKLGDLHFLRLKQRRGFFSKFEKQDCLGVINYLEGSSKLIASIAVACNLKLREVVNLRLADVNFKQSQLVVRYNNGNVKFSANLPLQLILELRIQVMRVKRIIQLEKETRYGACHQELNWLAKQLQPEWQYLFPHTFANKQKHTISRLNKMPLNLVKSDVRLAIKRYNRYSSFQSVEKNRANFNHDRQILINQDERWNNKKVPINRINHIKQTAFNFSDNLGAA